VSRLALVRFVAVAVLIGACDEAVIEPEPVVIRPATVAELTGPWRPTPLGLDVAMRTRVEQACRRDIEMPLGSVAAVIDARGASVVTVRMTGENPGSCDALEVMANGQVAGAGSGRRAEDREKLPILGPSELGPIEKQTIAGGNLKTEGWSVTGRAGVGITLVVVEPLNHMAVVATLENGWFGAWWPARPGEPPRDGARFPPFGIRAYDAFGVLQDEISK
jgi:hypothetical protein